MDGAEETLGTSDAISPLPGWRFGGFLPFKRWLEQSWENGIFK